MVGNVIQLRYRPTLPANTSRWQGWDDNVGNRGHALRWQMWYLPPKVGCVVVVTLIQALQYCSFGDIILLQGMFTLGLCACLGVPLTRRRGRVG